MIVVGDSGRASNRPSKKKSKRNDKKDLKAFYNVDLQIQARQAGSW